MLNISQAAQKLCMTQQSLSNQISRLESELQVQLFERSPKFKLTYAGRSILDITRQILEYEDRFYKQLDDISLERKGELRLGATRTRGRLLLPNILPLFNELYPNIELKVTLAENEVLFSDLLRGNIDLIICMQPPVSESSIRFFSIYTTGLCLVVPTKIMEKHFSTKELENSSVDFANIDIHIFQDEPFILHQQTNSLRSLCDYYFEKIDFIPKIVMESNDLEFLHRLSYTGYGVTCTFDAFFRNPGPIVPENTFLPTQPVYIIPISDPAVKTQLVIGYNSERYLTRAAQSFIELFQETFSKHNDVPFRA